MTNFFNRTTAEQQLVIMAYEFEIQAIENCDTSPNPYKEAIVNMGLWEALNEAVEMAY